MAQLPGDARVNQYTATAGQTTFIYDFKIYEDDEITVQQNSTTLTLTTDYTVTDAGEEAGGTIVLVTGATLNDIITLTGNSMVERETTFTNGGDFAASAINGEYNKILALLSENVTELGKTMRLKVYDPAFDASVPSPTAGKALKINATADGFVMSTNDPDEVVSDAQGYATAAADSATEASGYADDAADQVALAAAQVTLAEDQADLAEGFADDASDSADAAAASAASINLTNLESDIIPATTNTYTCGDATHRWSNVNTTTLTVAGTTTGQIFRPSQDNTHDLGQAALKWRDLYVGRNVTIDGTLTVGGSAVGSKAALYDYRVNYNVNGGNYTTANTWQTRPLNTEVYDSIGATLTSNRVTLPAGIYTAVADCSAYNTLYTAMRIYNFTTSSILGTGIRTYIGAAEGNVGCSAAFILASSAEIEVQHIGTQAQAGTGMGYAHNVSGEANYYTQLLITKVA